MFEDRYDYQQQQAEEELQRIDDMERLHSEALRACDEAYWKDVFQYDKVVNGDPRAWTRWFYESPVEAANAAREISNDFYFECARRMVRVHARFERFAKMERKRHVG